MTIYSACHVSTLTLWSYLVSRSHGQIPSDTANQQRSFSRQISCLTAHWSYAVSDWPRGDRKQRWRLSCGVEMSIRALIVCKLKSGTCRRDCTLTLYRCGKTPPFKPHNHCVNKTCDNLVHPTMGEYGALASELSRFDLWCIGMRPVWGSHRGKACCIIFLLNKYNRCCFVFSWISWLHERSICSLATQELWNAWH